MMLPDKFQDIAEAKRHLDDIETVIQTARTYLKYLEDVAKVVVAYSQEGTHSETIPQLAHLKDTGVVLNYLSNLTRACSTAESYISHLDGVAANVRDYLSKFRSSSQDEEKQEVKTRGLLADLEATIEAAKEHLAYLKGVASAVDDYLEDPINKALPPELANLELPGAAGQESAYTSSGHGPAMASTTASINLPATSTQKEDAATTLGEQMASGANARPLADKRKTDQGIVASSSSIGNARGAAGASYLDSLAASSPDGTSMFESAATSPVPSAYSSAPSSPAAARTGPPLSLSYLDQLSSSTEALTLTSGVSSTANYLENISSNPPTPVSFDSDGVESSADSVALSAKKSLPMTTQAASPTRPPSPSTIISSNLGDLVATLCCPRLMFSVYTNSKTSKTTRASLDRKCPCGAFAHCAMPTVLYSAVTPSTIKPLLLSPSAQVRMSDIESNTILRKEST